jgi:hypothetical protein
MTETLEGYDILTATEVAAIAAAGLIPAQGVEKVANSGLDAWTAGDLDDWTDTWGEAGEITQVGSGEAWHGTGTGSCNLYRATADATTKIRQTIAGLAAGTYTLRVAISYRGSGTLHVKDASASAYFDESYTTVGIKVISVVKAAGADPIIDIYLDDAGNVTVDFVSLSLTSSPVYEIVGWDETAGANGMSKETTVKLGNPSVRAYLAGSYYATGLMQREKSAVGSTPAWRVSMAAKETDQNAGDYTLVFGLLRYDADAVLVDAVGAEIADSDLADWVHIEQTLDTGAALYVQPFFVSVPTAEVHLYVGEATDAEPLPYMSCIGISDGGGGVGQSITAGGDRLVEFDENNVAYEYDFGGMFDTVAHEYVVPISGPYDLMGVLGLYRAAGWTSGATGELKLYVNGGYLWTLDLATAHGGTLMYVGKPLGPMFFVAGDVLSLYVNTSQDCVILATAASPATRFQMKYSGR